MTQEELIEESEARLLAALKIGDLKVLDELLHERLLFNIPTGMTITKAIDIENYRSGLLKISEVIATDRIIESIDEISTVTMTIDLKGSYAGQMIEGRFKYLRVWKVDGDACKVIAGSGFQIQ